jgi:glycosyltransferase involved in cell wall biosynthesis
MKECRVSVLLPVKNGVPFIAQALESLLQQSLEGFELIVVNDGSTDRTAEVLQHYARDARVTVLHLATSVGVPAALNLAMARAAGSYFARQDADDLSAGGRLGAQCSYLDRNPDVWLVGTQGTIVDDRGVIRGRSSFPLTGDRIVEDILAGQTPFFHGSWMFRRRCLEEVGGYNELFFGTEDKDYLLRISEHGAIANVNEFLYQYRTHGGAVTSANLGKRAFLRRVIVTLYRQRQQGGVDALGLRRAGCLRLGQVRKTAWESLRRIIASTDVGLPPGRRLSLLLRALPGAYYTGGFLVNRLALFLPRRLRIPPFR